MPRALRVAVVSMALASLAGARTARGSWILPSTALVEHGSSGGGVVGVAAPTMMRVMMNAVPNVSDFLIVFLTTSLWG